ncbi:GDP-mannose 4,6-dehydratase [Verrucomicrobiota bacterium]
MRVLVTGSAGFAGPHLIRELLDHDHEVVAFDLNPKAGHLRDIKTFAGDIQDSDIVDRVVAEVRPDACIHLSAISFVPEGWANIRSMFSVNLTGTLNVLEAFRKSAPEARVLVISSAEVYGSNQRNDLVTEDDAVNPDNPYAISKAAADSVTLLYAHEYSMHTMTARPGNHIGPGQSSRFVVASFAGQLSAVASGQDGPVRVGNLDSRRDFTDVRDVARAYRLLIEKGKAGQAYNIASGRTVMVRAVFDELCAIAGVRPDIEIDPALFRPARERALLDIKKIAADVGWRPEVPLSDTLRDIMADQQTDQ